MNRQILVHTILIDRAGQQQYFAINVPRDVTAIVGIQTGVQLIDVPVMSGTGQTGMLQLQATGRANGSYNSIVRLEPAQALKADLNLSAYQAGFSQANALLTSGLAQRGHSSPELIRLPACNSLYGNYKDVLGSRLGRDLHYRISITLWTTKQKL